MITIKRGPIYRPELVVHLILQTKGPKMVDATGFEPVMPQGQIVLQTIAAKTVSA